MSGGSFEYLCYKEAEELFGYNGLKQLKKMAERLTELGYEDAAYETEHIIASIQSAKRRIGVRKDRLENVWHAVEWYDGCDIGKEELDKAIEEYRDK